MSFSLSRKICIFPKGLTHDSGQKFEISLESAFLRRRPRCVFCDVVYKKNGFLDSKNGIFTQSKNLHDFGQKFEISFESAFL